jgi:hypothetical protein
MARVKDHVVDESPLATSCSDPLVILGMTALRAGSYKAQKIVSVKSRM